MRADLATGASNDPVPGGGSRDEPGVRAAPQHQPSDGRGHPAVGGTRPLPSAWAAAGGTVRRRRQHAGGSRGSRRREPAQTPASGADSRCFSAIRRPLADDDPQDEDQQPFVLDLVHDAVVAGADPPLTCAPYEPGCRRRSGLLGQQIERGLDAPPHLGVELAQLPRRHRRQGDAVGHANPRSALTCSQGIGASPVARISARACSAARMSAMSSASSRMRSRSSASMTAATRRPRRAR
jgi:hypothetical protein